jgi:hypothetical protein
MKNIILLIVCITTVLAEAQAGHGFSANDLRKELFSSSDSHKQYKTKMLVESGRLCKGKLPGNVTATYEEYNDGTPTLLRFSYGSASTDEEFGRKVETLTINGRSIILREEGRVRDGSEWVEGFRGTMSFSVRYYRLRGSDRRYLLKGGDRLKATISHFKFGPKRGLREVVECVVPSRPDTFY